MSSESGELFIAENTATMGGGEAAATATDTER
jgi:hypothetical protein